MASAKFDARLVREKAQAALSAQIAAREAANENNIQSSVGELIVDGVWPFRKYSVRTRAKAEAEYGSPNSWQTRRYWTELPFNRRISRITAILEVAAAAVGPRVQTDRVSDGFVTLDDEEVRSIGLHEVFK